MRPSTLRTRALALAIAATGLACEPTSNPVAPHPTEIRPPSVPSADISDATHHGAAAVANPHFYFLPPLVPPAKYGGTFDGAETPEVVICEYVEPTGCSAVVADYTMSAGPGGEHVRVLPFLQAYAVAWRTNQFALDAAKTYRIRVLVAGTELGHADVLVAKTSTQTLTVLKSVLTGQFLGLLDGVTLPITFRIEKGAIAAIGPSGGTLTLPGGALALSIPSGALAGTVGVTALPTTAYPADPEIVSTVYDLGPAGTAFATPASLTVHYDPSLLPPGAAADAVGLFTVTTDASGVEAWESVDGATVDGAAHTVTAPLAHLSRYAVLSQAGAVTVTPPSGTVYVPESPYGVAHNTLQLTAAITSRTGAVLARRRPRWKSSDITSASVSGGGLVTGIAGGTTTVTATSGTVSGASAIAVLRPVQSMTITIARANYLSLAPTAFSDPAAATAAVTLYDASNALITGREITYSSDNPAVATVDAQGLVTGIAPGRATITAASEGVSATLQDMPVEGPVVSLVLQAEDGSMSLAKASNLERGVVHAVMQDAAGNSLVDRIVSWGLDHPARASLTAFPSMVPGYVRVDVLIDGSATLTGQIEGKTASIAVELFQLQSVLNVSNSQPYPNCHDAGPFGSTYDGCARQSTYVDGKLSLQILGTTPNGFGANLFTFRIGGYGWNLARDPNCCGGGQTLNYLDPANAFNTPPGDQDQWTPWNTTVGVVTPGAGGVGDVTWNPTQHYWTNCGLFGGDHCYGERPQAASPWLAFYDWTGTLHMATIVSYRGIYYFRVRPWWDQQG